MTFAVKNRSPAPRTSRPVNQNATRAREASALAHTWTGADCTSEADGQARTMGAEGTAHNDPQVTQACNLETDSWLTCPRRQAHLCCLGHVPGPRGGNAGRALPAPIGRPGPRCLGLFTAEPLTPSRCVSVSGTCLHTCNSGSGEGGSGRTGSGG